MWNWAIMLRQLRGLFPFNQLEDALFITSQARAGFDVNIAGCSKTDVHFPFSHGRKSSSSQPWSRKSFLSQLAKMITQKAYGYLATGPWSGSPIFRSNIALLAMSTDLFGDFGKEVLGIAVMPTRYTIIYIHTVLIDRGSASRRTGSIYLKSYIWRRVIFVFSLGEWSPL